MGAMKENPRYNVVSLRLTDEEKQYWSEQQKNTRKSMSDLIREALNRAMDVSYEYAEESRHL